MSDTAERILAMVEHVRANEASIGVLSTGEQLAVALVLDRRDLLIDGYTMLEAANRLGPDWFEAAVSVQQSLPSNYYTRRQAA
jgi:hypothetical protein